jgi:molybdate transport system substrate-binding protein
MKAILCCLFLVGAFAGEGVAMAEQLAIAAAADLQFAFEGLLAEFRTNRPAIDVRIAYGSSGNFYAQLQNRAPYDLFFSADSAYPRKLAEAGLALDTNVFVYAIGRIVVWAPRQSTVEVEKLGIRSLLAPAAKRIAVANPEHAPYGKAAVAALKSLRVYTDVESKLVYGENIAQAAQFVQSGSADLGILALSLVAAPQMRDAGRYWQIPQEAYPSIEQGGIILSWTKEAKAARVFRDFVLGAHGREIFLRYGFLLPPP